MYIVIEIKEVQYEDKIIPFQINDGSFDSFEEAAAYGLAKYKAGNYNFEIHKKG